MKRSEEEEKMKMKREGSDVLRKKGGEGRVWFSEIRGVSDDL